MKKFEKPSLETIELDRMSVIATSGDSDKDCSDNKYDFENSGNGPVQQTASMRIGG